MKNTTVKGRREIRSRVARQGPERFGAKRNGYSYYHSSHRSDVAVRSDSTDKSSGREPRASRSGIKYKLGLVLVILLVILELPAGSSPRVEVAGSAGVASAKEIDSIKQDGEQILSSSVMNRTKLTLDQATLTEKLKEEFPIIDQASVSFSLFSYTPTISLKLRQPALVISAPSGNYLVGGDGTVIDHLSASGTSKQLPVLSDNSPLKITVGERALPGNYVAFITDLSSQLKSSGKQLSTLSLKSNSTEVDAHITGQSYLVKFNMMGNARTEAGIYLAAASYLAKKGITPAKYIDARVPGRVYYE